ncbi:MAG: hypothetical protein ACK4VI_04425 [Alphaproteobacteria bacterium]
MKSFLKENFVVILGISLPVILIAVFMIAQSFEKALYDPPRYAVIFKSGGNNLFQATVENNRLQLRFNTAANTNDRQLQHARTNPLVLHLFSPQTGKLETFRINAPERTATNQTITLDTPEQLAALTLDHKMTAPDGFHLIAHRNGSGGLFTEIFTSPRRNFGAAYRKDNYTYRIPHYTGYFHESRFIGWVIEE